MAVMRVVSWAVQMAAEMAVPMADMLVVRKSELSVGMKAGPRAAGLVGSSVDALDDS